MSSVFNVSDNLEELKINVSRFYDWLIFNVSGDKGTAFFAYKQIFSKKNHSMREILHKYAFF